MPASLIGRADSEPTIPANDFEKLPPAALSLSRTEHAIGRCIVCGAAKFERRFEDRWPWVCRCPDCGLSFANPQPSEAELATIYDDAYFESFGYHAQSSVAFRRIKRATGERLFSTLSRVAPDLHAGRLLDVGSGLGDLLTVARQRGWSAIGVEPNPWAVAEADRVAPGATRCGTLDDLPEPPTSFDLITCLDVFEHLREPDRTLRAMRELLRPGGAVLITTVDAGSYSARLSGSRWVHFHRDHLWYFRRSSLSRVVTSAGFDIGHWSVPRKVFNLRYVLGIFARHSSRPAAATCRGLLDRLPERLLSATWPGLPEGQLLIARKPRPNVPPSPSVCP